jgi:RNA polymerase sigma factor (sigma-70 family)
MLPPSPSDEELMERVQNGDRPAYRELFDRHHGRVYGFLVRRSRDRQVADDLFQETFLAIFRARKTWQPGRKFRPWMFAIASNVSRDHARRSRRQPETTDTEFVHAVYPRFDTRIHLEEAIAGMPDTLRDAFLLGVVEGFDHREVADQLSISPANARARISRGRAWLRERLRPEAT